MPVRKKTIKKKVVKHKATKRKSSFSFKKLLAPFLVLAGVVVVLSYTLLPKHSVLSSQVASEGSLLNVSPIFSKEIKMYPTSLAPKAQGKILVDVVEYREWINGKDRIIFKLNGKFSGLLPGKMYKLALCYNTSNTNCVAPAKASQANSSGELSVNNELLDISSSTSYKFKILEDLPAGEVPKGSCNLEPCLETTFNYIGGMEQSTASGKSFNISSVCRMNGEAWMNTGHVDVQIDLDNSKLPGKWVTLTLRDANTGKMIRVMGMSPNTRTITGLKYHGNAADSFSQAGEAEVITFNNNKKYILDVWEGDFRSELPSKTTSPIYSQVLNIQNCDISSTPTPSETSCGNIILQEYSYANACSRGTYKSFTFSCTDGFGYTIGGSTSACRTLDDFKKEASEVCASRTATCVVTPTQDVTPTQMVTPTQTKQCKATMQYVRTKTACKPFKSGSTTGMEFGCSDGYVGTRTSKTCTTSASWTAIAKNECAKRMTACK